MKFTEPAPAVPSANPLPARGLVAFIGCFMMLQPLSTDMYLPSLPGLTEKFGASVATVQLTLSVFVLGFGFMQLVSGPLSDRFGRRPVVIAGIALYVVASLGCAMAPTMTLLIAGRFFQAVGCCTAVVVARAIVRDAFGAEGSAHAMAQALSVLAVAAMVGPALGGLLEVRFGHRAVFVVLAVFAGVLLILTAARLPETNAHLNARATRPRHLLASYGLVVRSREFLAFTLFGSATYGGLFAFISGSSFVLIRVLDVPPGWFGVAFASVVVGYLLGTLWCQRMLARHGLRTTVTVGVALAACGVIAMVTLALAGVHHWAAIIVPQFVYMASHGINFPCAMAGTVGPFPQHAGTAAGMFGFLSMAAAAAIGAWIGASHDGTVFPMVFAIAGAASVSLLTVMLYIRPHLARR